jgi:hypothetical protein
MHIVVPLWGLSVLITDRALVPLCDPVIQQVGMWSMTGLCFLQLLVSMQLCADYDMAA